MKSVDDVQDSNEKINDSVAEKINDDSFSFSYDELSVFSDSNNNIELSFDMSYSKLK